MSTEHAWAAGFFDGEGTVGRHHNRKTGQRQPYMSIFQVELAPLERFLAAVEVGAVRGPYAKSGARPQWAWRVARRTSIEHALRLLWPYLCEPKKRQALAACPELAPVSC